MITKTYTIEIDIVCANLQVNSEKELAFAESYEGFTNLVDINGDDYIQFVNKIKSIMNSLDYIINKEEFSPYKGSNSNYFEFLKFNDDVTIKVAVFIRVSDHDVGIKKIKGVNTKSKDRRVNYLKTTRLPQLKQDFNTTEDPNVEIIDIIIDGQHCPSYDDAYNKFDRFVKSHLYKYR